MQFNIIVALSLFLSVSVSAIQFVNPKDVLSGVPYSLTLSTNPTRLLVSHDARLRVETFNAIEPFNAENLGPDNGRRWGFHTAMDSLLNYETMAALRYDAGTLKTDSQSPFPDATHIQPTSVEGGMKIKVLGDGGNVDKWVNDMGHIVLEESSGAIWMITKTEFYKA